MQNITGADFYKPSPYNCDTKTQIWLSQVADGHDNFCNCNAPFGHLLASIFPPGHKDRDITINKILGRDLKECLSGGTDERNSGGAGDAAATKPTDTGVKPDPEEEDLPGDEVEELIAAAENIQER